MRALGLAAEAPECWNGPVGDDARLRVRVLGPLRVTGPEGADLTPSGSLQRRLLALLVLRRGRVTSAGLAAEALWPDAPGEHLGALQSQVSRLRRGLPDAVIDSVGGGYRLRPDAVTLDADQLATLLAGADPTTTAMAELERLLAGWHGPAYPELADTDEGRAESARLEDLGVRAAEFRAAAGLAAGRLDGLSADLRALADAHPFRERPRALLIQVLVAEGRRAEALRVYDEFRRLLAEELGVDPSAELAAAHAALLQDPLAPAWTPTTRVPVPATRLIGRDDLLVHVLDCCGTGRLVTLVGPGGVGKTRLALAVAGRLRDARPDGSVVFCELAAADPATAVDTVAAALGVDARPGEPMGNRLVSMLADLPVVLVLDNCEHVLEPVADLAVTLLAGCPRLTLVVTTRERLRVPGEQVVPIAPLDAVGEAAPAAELFIERARAAAPGFDPGSGEEVAEIVRRLDGLPLAIELAAARLHTHDLAEVASGLDRRVAFLSTGYRTAGRHASLGAAIDWSYGLLEPDLRRTFASLSVFAGPFGVRDAAVVGSGDPRVVEAALTALVERSLLQRTDQRQYLMLETLREYGAEQLTAAGQRDEVAERHAYCQVGWVESAWHRARQPGSAGFDAIDARLPELRNALAWLLAHGRVEDAGHLVVGLFEYCLLRLRPDVMLWSVAVIEADRAGSNRWACQLWAMRAYAAWMQGRMTDITEFAERAVAMAGERLPFEAVAIRGNVALFRGDLDEAADWYRRGIAASGPGSTARIFLEATLLLALGYAGDPRSEALAAAVLAAVGDEVTPHAAYAWFCAGEAVLASDPGLARRRLGRAMELAEATSASFVTGVAGSSRASLDARDGDPHQAAGAYVELIHHWRRAGMWSTQWTTLRSITGLLVRLGRFQDAAVLEGAVRATSGGHRIFGADEAAMRASSDRLRAALGDHAYEAARRAGAGLDWDGAVDHALACLRRPGARTTRPNPPS